MQFKSRPTCGSQKIERVRWNWQNEFEGKRYVVSALEFYECPVCGERVFDPQAMRKIESVSPAFRNRKLKRPA